MKRFVISFFVLLFLLSSNSVSAQSHFTIDHLLQVRRVGDPQLSPDGRQLAFTIGDVKFDANRLITHIYVMPIGGGAMKQLTSDDASATSPRWSPDGKKIAYTTGNQIWVMDDDGGGKDPVTKISTGAAGPICLYVGSLSGMPG
jgi:Tol biopolymer transport system component